MDVGYAPALALLRTTELAIRQAARSAAQTIDSTYAVVSVAHLLRSYVRDQSAAECLNYLSFYYFTEYLFQDQLRYSLKHEV